MVLGSRGHDQRNYDEIFRKSHHESERIGIFIRNLSNYEKIPQISSFSPYREKLNMASQVFWKI